MVRTDAYAPCSLAPVVPILIDGQNLFHALQLIGVREQDIDWEKFAQHLAGPGNRGEIFWFRAGEAKVISLSKSLVLEMLIREKYPQREAELKAAFRQRQLPHAIYQEVNRLYREREDWLKQEQDAFHQVDRSYERLANRYAHLHLCHRGMVRFDPYQQKCLGEKGVDVAISVKMIQLAYQSSCTKIILLSGDLDFIEAVKAVQEMIFGRNRPLRRTRPGSGPAGEPGDLRGEKGSERTLCAAAGGFAERKHAYVPHKTAGKTGRRWDLKAGKLFAREKQVDKQAKEKNEDGGRGPGLEGYFKAKTIRDLNTWVVNNGLSPECVESYR